MADEWERAVRGFWKWTPMKSSLLNLAVVLLASLITLHGADAGINKPLGLSTGPNTTVLKNGQPYRGVGVNYFDCFLRTLSRGDDTSYDAGFATLARKEIPFARFCATGFWPKDMQPYQTNRAEYFRRLDGVVNSAQKHGVGLVPSLFWFYSCVPDLVGEPMDQWANPKSKTQAWMREYVRETVTRYRNNPTIWFWEFGNEYSLGANLPNAKEHRPAVHPTLGTLWVFDLSNQKDFNVTATIARSWQLDLIAEANKTLRNRTSSEAKSK